MTSLMVTPSWWAHIKRCSMGEASLAFVAEFSPNRYPPSYLMTHMRHFLWSANLLRSMSDRIKTDLDRGRFLFDLTSSVKDSRTTENAACASSSMTADICWG